MLQAYYQEDLIEAGCDEAGRGCLAGPVYAAAVILPRDFYHPLLNDSKQLTEQERYELRPIIEKEALAYAVASLCNKKIDKYNILRASFMTMHIALKQLELKPGLILVDGNRFIKYKRVPHKCIIEGDAIYASIAAASILAKTYRDDYMKLLHNKYKRYNWASNKGYATREHQAALNKYGPCRYHRTSFRLDYSQPLLFSEEMADAVDLESAKTTY
jgi:ribonuclease HII